MNNNQSHSKLILLDGGPAAGKNTLGDLLIKKYQERNFKAILLDLDTYVEKINPGWIWKNKQEEIIDQNLARENLFKDINYYIKAAYLVIVIGERFLTKENISNFIKKLKYIVPVFLYHLNIPFSLRKKRLEERGPHSLIDLEKDQKDRDMNKIWYGYVYENINTVEIDAGEIFKLIECNIGILDKSLFY